MSHKVWMAVAVLGVIGTLYFYNEKQKVLKAMKAKGLTTGDSNIDSQIASA